MIGWRTPLDSRVISSGFDRGRIDPVDPSLGVVPHLGTDFGVPVGTPVYAPFDGRVEHWWPVDPPVDGFTSPRPLNGNCLFLRESTRDPASFDFIDGAQAILCHLLSSEVFVRDRFRKGDVIAHTGNTGKTTGPHLHFEVHVDGVAVDVETLYPAGTFTR